MHVALLLLLVLLWWAPEAMALDNCGTGVDVDNSAEVGPADFNPGPVVFADDFDDGDWNYCDLAQCSTGPNDDDGWAGNADETKCSSSGINVPGTSAPTDNYANCNGSGAAGTPCAASSRDAYEIDPPCDCDCAGGAAVKSHGLDEIVTGDLYWRGYMWAHPNAVFKAEKVLAIMSDDSSNGGASQFGFFKTNQGGGPTLKWTWTETAPQNNIVCNMNGGCSWTPGRWFAFEIHLGLSSDTLELWWDDCGVDGLGCPGGPVGSAQAKANQTLAMQYTSIDLDRDCAPDVCDSVELILVEQWAPNCKHASTPPLSQRERMYDQFVVSKERIGWAATSATPTLDATPAVVNVDENITITPDGSNCLTPPTTWSVDTNACSPDPATGPFPQIVTCSTSGLKTFVATPTDGDCEGATAQAQVTVNAPTPVLSASPNPGIENEVVTWTATCQNCATEPTQCNWDLDNDTQFDDGTTSFAGGECTNTDTYTVAQSPVTVGVEFVGGSAGGLTDTEQITVVAPDTSLHFEAVDCSGNTIEILDGDETFNINGAFCNVRAVVVDADYLDVDSGGFAGFSSEDAIGDITGEPFCAGNFVNGSICGENINLTQAVSYPLVVTVDAQGWTGGAQGAGSSTARLVRSFTLEDTALPDFILHLPMDEGTGTTTTNVAPGGSGEVFNFHDDPQWDCADTPSGSGCSLVFDGGDALLGPATINPGGSDAMSICAFFKPTSAYTEDSRIIAKADNTSNAIWDLKIESSSPIAEQLRMALWTTGAGDFDFKTTDPQLNFPAPSASWYHACWTYDDTDLDLLRFYGAGTFEESTTHADGGVVQSDTTTAVTVGAAFVGGASPTRPFVGKIDDVRIYTRKLLDSEISDIASAIPPATCTVMLALDRSTMEFNESVTATPSVTNCDTSTCGYDIDGDLTDDLTAQSCVDPVVFPGPPVFPASGVRTVRLQLESGADAGTSDTENVTVNAPTITALGFENNFDGYPFTMTPDTGTGWQGLSGGNLECECNCDGVDDFEFDTAADLSVGCFCPGLLNCTGNIGIRYTIGSEVFERLETYNFPDMPGAVGGSGR